MCRTFVTVEQQGTLLHEIDSHAWMTDLKRSGSALRLPVRLSVTVRGLLDADR